MSAAVASPVKKVAKKASKPKVPAAHPPFASMVVAAIGALKEKKGSSKIGVVNYIMKNYKVGEDKLKVNRGVKVALKGGVAKGTLKQMKGTGASGSFRLGDKPKAVKKPKAAAKKVKKPKKAAATKPKKASSPKKAKTPKKAAKKPAAKKAAAAKPKKVKTPKKAAAKKPAAKKPAAKKAAAKKPAKK